MEAAEILASAIKLAAEGSADSDEYWELVRTLHQTPEQHVFDLAAGCCNAATPSERSVGADVLSQLGHPSEWDKAGQRPFTNQSAPLLRGLLSNSDVDVLTSAIHALGHHHIASAADLAGLLHHPSAEVRHAIAFALDSDDPQARGLLFELMRDADVDVRDWATFAIGSQSEDDTPEIRDALVSRLTDADEGVRGEALVGLARRGDSKVIDMILAGLNPVASYLWIDAAELILEHFPNETRISDALVRCTPRN